jgi:hypothetical protein
MKINASDLMAIAVQLAKGYAAYQKTQAELRAIIARESPESLAEFDARVAAAREPWQAAADAGAAENAAIRTEE